MTRTAASHDVLGSMADDIRQLTRPYRAPIQRHRWDHNRNRKTATELVWHAPLLEQLRAAAEPGQGRQSPRRAKPGSRPPANLDALDRLHTIVVGLATWQERIHGHVRRYNGGDWTVQSLTALVDEAKNLAPAIADELAQDVATWWAWAAKQAGWNPNELRRLTS